MLIVYQCVNHLEPHGQGHQICWGCGVVRVTRYVGGVVWSGSPDMLGVWCGKGHQICWGVVWD